jgi:hypothetical protein
LSRDVSYFVTDKDIKYAECIFQTSPRPTFRDLAYVVRMLQQEHKEYRLLAVRIPASLADSLTPNLTPNFQDQLLAIRLPDPNHTGGFISFTELGSGQS